MDSIARWPLVPNRRENRIGITRSTLPFLPVRNQSDRQYIDHGMAAYEATFKEQQLKWLSRKAAELHFRLAPIPDLAV
jgi:hypothetical protein